VVSTATSVALTSTVEDTDAGDMVKFDEMMQWPKPVQKPHPPIIVGGGFPHGARRAINYGNGWMPIGGRGGDTLGMLPPFHEMLKKARENAAKVGARNVEFRLGELEHLPVADNTADVVISNCVIVLVPDKSQVFREAFRALKPGGRIAISDVLNTTPIPADLKADTALLCGCMAGAASVEQISRWLREAGFVEIQITPKPESGEMVAAWAPGRGIEDYVISANVEARKPG